MMRNIFNVGFLVMALSLMGGWTPSVLAAKGGDAYWAYEGEEGPANWGDLSSQFSTCQKGKSQSPIDILSSTQADLGDIDIQYQASPLTVVNNGHTIQVNYAPGSFIKIGGEKYHLLQFHFHSPSEHKINGKAGDMVVHLVHKSADGNLAVIGVLLNEGKPNGVVRTVWDNLPGGAGKTKSLGKVQVNASDMIPKDRAYYNYSGSLTTPPCTEGVNWIVMKSPVSVSKEQVARFKSIFPLSVRPVQPLHGRKINANK